MKPGRAVNETYWTLALASESPDISYRAINELECAGTLQMMLKINGSNMLLTTSFLISPALKKKTMALWCCDALLCFIIQCGIQWCHVRCRDAHYNSLFSSHDQLQAQTLSTPSLKWFIFFFNVHTTQTRDVVPIFWSGCLFNWVLINSMYLIYLKGWDFLFPHGSSSHSQTQMEVWC